MACSKLLLMGALMSVGSTSIHAQTTGAATPATLPQSSDRAVTPNDSGQIADIVVTAQRRSESAQKVPISISVLNGDAISPAQAQSSIDIAKQVVGLQFNQVYATSNPTIFIRGVGVNDYNAASSGAVGVVVDDVVLASSVGQLFSLYDVDRVEVLRGPQGTLFGRNTTGGVLNFVTRKPSFTPSVDSSITYGRFNQADIDAAVGGPLVSNEVAGRLSVLYHRRDGYVTDVVDPTLYPNTPGNGSKTGQFDTFAGRGQLLFKPADNLDFDLMVEGGRRRGSAIPSKAAGTFNNAAGRPCTGAEILQVTTCGNGIIHSYVSFADPDRSTYNSDVSSYENLDNFETKLGVDWNIGGVKLTSISAYVHNERNVANDQYGIPYALFENPLLNTTSNQTTQEIRLASDDSGTLKWIAGAFYLHENLSQDAIYNYAAQFATFDFSEFAFAERSSWAQKSDSYAAFAQSSYQITSKLDLTGGVRFTHDKKEIDFQTYAGANGIYSFALPVIVPLIAPIADRLTDSKPTWRVALDYDVVENVLLYSSYDRGFRSGGWNTGANILPIEFTEVRPEKIDALEGGFKSDLLERHVRLNGSIFYYKYTDQQVYTLGTSDGIPYTALQNANSKLYGGELEAVVIPAHGLELRSGAAYLHGRYTKLDDPVQGDLAGRHIEKSPTVQLSAAATYKFDLTDKLTGSTGIDGSYQTRIFLDPSNRLPLTTAPYGLLNAQLGVQSTSGFSATLWVKNLTDKRYIQDQFDLAAFGFYGFIYNLPRTFGVTLNYKM